MVRVDDERTKHGLSDQDGFLVFAGASGAAARASGPDETGQESVGPIQALFAAREAVGDIAGICERKPEVCETGKSAMHTITVRAKETAKIAARHARRQVRRPRYEPDTATSAPEDIVLPGRQLTGGIDRRSSTAHRGPVCPLDARGVVLFP